MLSEKKSLWLPRYTLTPAIARALMDIEAARAVVENTPMTPTAEAELRRLARIRSYGLSAIYWQYIKRLSAIDEDEK